MRSWLNLADSEILSSEGAVGNSVFGFYLLDRPAARVRTPWLHLAPGHGAAPCKSPAMPNGRCRIHGGKASVPKGNKNNPKDGRYTAGAIAHRRKVGVLLRAERELVSARKGAPKPNRR
jgi:hypothetical protein